MLHQPTVRDRGTKVAHDCSQTDHLNPDGQKDTMMLKKASIAGLLLVLAASFGFAQEDERARGERACKGDAARLCKDVLQEGDSAVLACFQKNQSRLSAPCRKFLAEQGQIK